MMKRKLVTIQIIQTIFVGIMFIIVQLQKNSIINTNKSFMAFYILLIFLYWITMLIVIVILMIKNKKEEKILFINMVLISIELVVLGIFCGSINNRIDKIEFLKHCNETTATVYYVEETEGYRKTDVGDPEYRKKKTYKLCSI